MNMKECLKSYSYTVTEENPAFCYFELHWFCRFFKMFGVKEEFGLFLPFRNLIVVHYKIKRVSMFMILKKVRGHINIK